MKFFYRFFVTTKSLTRKYVSTQCHQKISPNCYNIVLPNTNLSATTVIFLGILHWSKNCVYRNWRNYVKLPDRPFQNEKPSYLTRKENVKFEYKYSKKSNKCLPYNVFEFQLFSFFFYLNIQIYFLKSIIFFYHKTSLPHGRQRN